MLVHAPDVHKYDYNVIKSKSIRHKYLQCDKREYEVVKHVDLLNGSLTLTN